MLDGTLVKPTQQVLVDVPLAVPPATLDNELQPNNDADGASICLLGVEIVEPVDAQCETNYIYKYLPTECDEDVVELDNAQPLHRP